MPQDKDPQNRSRIVIERRSRPVAPTMDKRGRVNPYDPRLSPFSHWSRGREVKQARKNGWGVEDA
jgi:hypothetical protein